MSSTSTRRSWSLVGDGAPGATRAPERRARALSGLPPQPRGGGRWRRLLTSRWTWVALAMLALYVACGWYMWHTLSADRQQGEVVVPGVDWATVVECAQRAAPTALVWSAGWILLDRLRPMRPLLWLAAFGWGATVSVAVSLVVNTWAAEMMNVTAGAGDPAAQARPAVFSAPFVEEAAKASILFLLAVLVRYRIASVLQAAALAGLSAIGFAFTENIVYYARVLVYGSMTAGAGDVEDALDQMVFLRGVITSYGHPLFTLCTGIGLALGLRTRSKLVRVLAPLTGWVVAALGHMYFNGTSSTTDAGSMRRYVIQFVLVVGGILFFMLRHWLKELRRLRTRLGDYVQMGWLDAADVANQGSAWRRFRLCLVALFRGPGTFLATLRLMRCLTELAYLRDAMVRGIVDEAGQEREKELLAEAHALRPVALWEARGLKLEVDWSRLAVWRRLRRRGSTPAVGTGGWPAPRT